MRFIWLMCCCFTHAVYSASVSVNWQAVNLADALRIAARESHFNVMISPEVTGVSNLHLQEVKPESLFESLLVANHLGKIRIGNIWYVAPHASLMKVQEEKKQRLLGNDAPLLTQSWRIKYARAKDIAELIQSQLQSEVVQSAGGVKHVSFDGRTNMVIMRDTAKRIAVAQRLIHKLDVPVQQVLIETRLVSIDVDAEKQLGVQFITHQQKKNDDAAVSSSQQGRVVFTIARLADSSQLDVALSALEQNGRAELISSPSLFANSQQEASIEAGEEVPYQEVSRSGGTAVAFKKAVLGLKVTPQVLPDNRILLSLQINQDRPASRMVGGVPAISTRQIKTSALLKDGQTVVLGGIYELAQEKTRSSIPFLGKIPVIGLLFTHNAVRRNKRELLIFVTPRIKTI